MACMVLNVSQPMNEHAAHQAGLNKRLCRLDHHPARKILPLPLQSYTGNHFLNVKET